MADTDTPLSNERRQDDYYTTVPCFIMHMKKHTHRYDRMNELMKSLGFKNYKFIEPYPATEETKKLLEKQLNSKSSAISLSQASHFMTYLSILQDNNFNDIFIIEDDLKLIYHLGITKSILNFCVNNYPSDTDMMYFEFINDCETLDENKDFTKLKSPVCTACIYYPSKEVRTKIVNSISNYAINHNENLTSSDITIASLISKNEINAYAHIQLFTQDHTLISSIEGSLKNELPVCLNEKYKLFRNSYYNTEQTNIIKEKYAFNIGLENTNNKNYGLKIVLLLSIIIIIGVIIYVTYRKK